MEELLKRKRVLKGKLTRLVNLVNNLNEETITAPEIEHFTDDAKKLCVDINEFTDELLVTCDDDRYVEYEQEMHNVLNKLDSVKIKLRTLVLNKNDQKQTVPGTSATACPHDNTVQLPKIQLPTFSGDLLQWISFRDLFNASVHNKESLSAAQKLQYLKLSLAGEAATLLQALQISDANYEKAWKILSDRYENENEIIHAALDRLFTLPNILHESAAQLRKLLDVTNQCIGTLEIMKQPVKHWDSVLVYVLKRKLDHETLKQWMLTQSNRPATYEELRRFLDQRARALSSLGAGSVSAKVASKPKLNPSGYSNPVKGALSTHHITNVICGFCKDPHSIFKCSKFQNLPLSEKWNAVLRNKLCANCLRTGHFKFNCQSSGCKVCKDKHHSMLHRWEVRSPAEVEQNVKKLVSNHTLEFPRNQQSLLPTCRVVIVDRSGTPHTCRALIDSGSQLSFMTESCVQTLRLKRKPNRMQVTGISPIRDATTTNGTVSVILRSQFEQNSTICVKFHILSKITCNLPQTPVTTSDLSCFNFLKLADDQFWKPGSIDLLLGADVCAEVFLEGHLKAPNRSILAQETKFGWILFGSTNAKPMNKAAISVHHTALMEEDCLQKFWDLEEVPNVKPLTFEEQTCESFFKSTHSRNEEGRFVVSLPFRDNGELGLSRETAVKRLLQTERRFARDQHLASDYNRFMKEYVDLGHMERVPESEITKPEGLYFYLPHHAVPNKSGDKFRVVFDGSSKTSTGLSLNEKLMVGPQLQSDLISLLLRFRMNKIALVADIEKMYRQVLTRDTDFQRIVWRDDPSTPVQDYRLLTVTYGTASAPYLAIKSLQQLAKDQQHRFPEAASVVCDDFYVDDLLTGVQTRADAVKLLKDTSQLLSEGGFTLKKWASNDATILESMPADFRATKDSVQLNFDAAVKTLGILWQPATDEFKIKSELATQNTILTKRQLLSIIAKLFDPLGWISPVTIRCKILMQDVWRAKLDWNDQVPNTIAVQWARLLYDLSSIKDIKIPRCINNDPTSQLELHGFSDASEKAYAAAVYLHATAKDGTVSVNLIISKTRVAPLKTVSLPRLELCGALLLSKLMNYVVSTLNLLPSEAHYWTDSTIVLCWLNAQPSRWKTFIANRVAKIQDLTSAAQWHHIRSEQNPADLATRGVSPSSLDASHWWNGPNLLYQCPIPILDPLDSSVSEELLEQRKQVVLLTNPQPSVSNEIHDLTLKFSSLSKLKRVLAYCLRFTYNCMNPQDKRKGFLTANELRESMTAIIKCAQSIEFKDEIGYLRKSQAIPRKSKILPLNPFLDCAGIVRVGGRLRHADGAEDTKHPILIPRNHHLTDLIIWEHHEKNLHAGPLLTQASLQQQFWIVSGKREIRRVLRNCVACVRQAAQTPHQIMGDLPSSRIRPSRPFLHAGIDYAGPFIIRMSKGARGKTCRAYLALFVCFSTKAVHCELVSDLSTTSFIATLKRFIARRGKPSDLYSDCGTNFIGANRELKDLYSLCRDNSHNAVVSKHLANDGINWHFNPPASPHMGGLWEAGIKSVKYHLKRIISRHVVLTFEELYTLICQVESSLNSRPLCPMSSDPNDLSALTPGHFLIGGPMNAIPEPDYTLSKLNRLTRWQLIQRLFQHFWSRWKVEYLSQLQKRSKWHRIRQNLKVGDLVIIKDERFSPMQWKLGRVTEIHAGSDGVVRVASVKTCDGEMKRNIQKLCILPSENCYSST